MSSPSVDQLIDPGFIEGLRALPLSEIRSRRSQCQDAEEALSLRRRLVQGRLDIVQAELLRRAGGGSSEDVSKLVESLPDILVERGDRHLGPGRLTSLDTDSTTLGPDFDAFAEAVDRVVGGARLTKLADDGDEDVRTIADKLDQLERDISHQRHQLHAHIDRFQEEIVRRYKSGEATVDTLLNGED